LVVDKNIRYKEELLCTLLKSESVVLINVQQFTKHSETGASMHAENGFFKILPSVDVGTGERHVEAMLSHPFSLNEFEFGSCNESKMEICASLPEHFQRGKTSKGQVTTGFRRVYFMNDNGNLCYRMYLGINNQEMHLHLEAELSPQRLNYA